MKYGDLFFGSGLFSLFLSLPVQFIWGGDTIIELVLLVVNIILFSAARIAYISGK